MISKIRQLRENKAFVRYFVNSSWMIFEYGLKIVSALLVSVYVARYLGPENFGVLSYALAIVAVFMVISRLGMESILVRDLSRHFDQQQAYLGTAFSLMILTAVLGVVILGALVFLIEEDYATRLYVWVISIGMIFQSFLAIDYNFQAQIKAKNSSLAKSIALVIGSVLKIALVWYGANILYFAVAYSLDQVIVALALIFVHIKKKQPNFIFVFRKSLVRPLLSSAWPMVLSGVSAVLYMRIDQLMIKHMMSPYELGLYSAAAKIYEGWVIIPYVISISMLPAIVGLKTRSASLYEAGMVKLFALVFWPGILVAILVSLFGGTIVSLTFGEEYMGATKVLAISLWAVAFTGLGAVTSRYLTVEGLEKKIAFRTLIALCINVTLNYILIPRYGIEGAAVATLVTILAANYFINYVDTQLKPLVRICNHAITLRFLFKETE